MDRNDVVGTGAGFAWAGYYTGEYFMRDYSGPLKLARHIAILESDTSRSFAQAGWRMMALPHPVPADAGTLDLAGATVIDATCVNKGTASGQIRFHLGAPSLVVENEIYWDGWTAVLTCIDCKDKQQTFHLNALEAGGFRAWQLPAGSYEMKMQFHTPQQKTATLATTFGVLLWILLFVIVFWSHKQKRKARGCVSTSW